MNLEPKHASVASYGFVGGGNLVKVSIPIRSDLLIDSVIATLVEFMDWNLLSASIILTDTGNAVEFVFQKKGSFNQSKTKKEG